MKEQKPNLVMLHGLFGGSNQWEMQIKEFSKKFNVITPNLPGFGQNSFMESPYTINENADYIIEFLDKTCIQNFNLLGHSMGGMIAQVIAVKIPQRVNRLILYGTGALGIMPGRFESIEDSKKKLLKDGVEISARHICEKWFLFGSQSDNFEKCAEIALKASEQAAFAGLTAMQNWTGIDDLLKIESPTLILWGDNDRSYTKSAAIQLYTGIKKSTLYVVVGGSHVIHLEKSDVFNKIVYDFIG